MLNELVADPPPLSFLRVTGLASLLVARTLAED